MANESFLSLSASSLELKPATRSEPSCSTPQFNPFSPLHFVALLITSIKVLCLSVAANLHAAATEQKVCVCLALETLLSRDQKVLAEGRIEVYIYIYINIYMYIWIGICMHAKENRWEIIASSI